MEAAPYLLAVLQRLLKEGQAGGAVLAAQLLLQPIHLPLVL